MAVTLNRLPDEPILIANYSGHVTADEVIGMYTESDRIIHPDEKRVFRIANVTDIQSDFMQVMKIAREAGKGLPGSTSDPRITAIMVGTDKWAKLLAELLHHPQYGGMDIPFFRDLASAYEYIDVEMKKLKRSA